jgi:four helix bundle protein
MANQQTRNQQTRNLAAYNYRKLDVWQQAQEIAAHIVRLAADLPRDPSVAVISRQLVASAGSVAANIAEGHGRFTFAAYRNHLSIAKGSACEADSWLDLLRRTGHISAEREAALHDQLLSVIAVLTTKIRSLDASAREAAQTRVRKDDALYGVEGGLD